MAGLVSQLLKFTMRWRGVDSPGTERSRPGNPAKQTGDLSKLVKSFPPRGNEESELFRVKFPEHLYKEHTLLCWFVYSSPPLPTQTTTTTKNSFFFPHIKTCQK